MHLCYVDDSGDSRRGSTLTALIIEDREWATVLDAWLDGRRELQRIFGVPKLRELHANRLFKGRGDFCETPRQNRAFGDVQRAAAGRIMLSQLSKNSRFTTLTVVARMRSSAAMYGKFVGFLEKWAETRDTTLMIFYDGQHGIDETGELNMTERRDLWDQAIRSAAPYRAAHRSLELRTRRIVEDVIMQDSRYSQLIQAVDLIAYGAFHKHVQQHPEVWGTSITPEVGAIRAYMQTAAHWPHDSSFGVYWLE